MKHRCTLGGMQGIGTSFGFNRTENLDSYSSAEDLIKLLVSTVSAGGNLYLTSDRQLTGPFLS
jgi:hypothetical protein